MLLESNVSGGVAVRVGFDVLSVSGGVRANTVSVALLFRVDAFAIPSSVAIAQGVGSTNVDELEKKNYQSLVTDVTDVLTLAYL